MTLGGPGKAFSAGGGVGATGTFGTSFSIDGSCFGGAELAFGGGAFGIYLLLRSFGRRTLLWRSFLRGSFFALLGLCFLPPVCGAAFG